MVEKLVINHNQLNTIMDQIKISWPLETCGFLAGAGGLVERVYPVANVAAQPGHAFSMDSQQQINALLNIEKSSQELLAIYHSHPPLAITSPSTNDLVLFQNYSNIYQIIVMPSWNRYIASIRVFSLSGNAIQEHPLRIQK